MNKKIKEVCDIRVGYTLKKSLTKYPKGNVLVLQGRDLSNDDWSDIIRIKLDDKVDHFLCDKTILLSARGSFMARVYYRKKIPVIASSSIIIINLKNKQITPEYLAMFLNSAQGQAQLESYSGGSRLIKSISKKDLLDVKIPIISLEKQDLLHKMYKSSLKQRELVEQKQKLVKEIINTSINKIIKEK